jgi:hypothetical protein
MAARGMKLPERVNDDGRKHFVRKVSREGRKRETELKSSERRDSGGKFFKWPLQNIYSNHLGPISRFLGSGL